MKPFGILLMANVVAVAAYLLIAGSVESKKVITFAGIGITAALLLLVADRITGAKLPVVGGEFTAATERAIAGADRIEAIEGEARKQGDNIAVILRDANRAREDITRIDKFATDAKKKSEDLEKVVTSAEKARAELSSIAEFNMLLTQLGTDNRKAFDALMETANSGKEPYKDMAVKALVNHATSTVTAIQMDIGDWSVFGFEPTKATVEQYRTFIETTRRNDAATSAVSMLWEQERFSKKDRLELLANILLKTESVRVLSRACTVMNIESKVNKNILAWGDYLKWWSANSASYPKVDASPPAAPK